MAKETRRTDRLVVRLESDARAKLKAKAAALGLDDATFVRMLIYRDLNDLAGQVHATPVFPRPAYQPHNDGTGTSTPAEFPLPEFANRIRGGNPAGADSAITEPPEEIEPLPVEEMDIPADADRGNPGNGGNPGAAFDELMRAGPSILDEMMALSQPAPAIDQASQRLLRAPIANYRAARRPGLQPVAGPGSLTRAVGINNDAVGYMGQSPNGVLKDNMRHFGTTGTRSR